MQQRLAAIQQGLQSLIAQKFNDSARHRNSVQAKAQDDLPLVPLQVSVVNAAVLKGVADTFASEGVVHIAALGCRTL